MKRGFVHVLFGLGLIATLAGGAMWLRGRWVIDAANVNVGWRVGTAVYYRAFRIESDASGVLFYWNLGPHRAADNDPLLQVRYTPRPRYVFPFALPADAPLWNRLGIYYEPSPVRGRGLVKLPWWLILLIPAPPTLWRLVRIGRTYLRRRADRTAHGLCANCGYDLRGAAHGRCPECGEPIVAPAAV